MIPLLSSYQSDLDIRLQTEYVQRVEFPSAQYEEYNTFALYDGYIVAFQQNSAEKINSQLVTLAKGMNDSVIPEYIVMGNNYKKFLTSFKLHGGDAMPPGYQKDFEQIANVLSALPMKETLVQYSQFDNMIDFLIVLQDGMRLSVGKFTDEAYDDNEVDFTLYDKKIVLLSGEIKPELLVKKIRQIHQGNTIKA